MQKLVPADAVLIPDDANRVFEGKIFDVYRWQQKLYDGSFSTFEMLRRPDTVSAVGIVNGKILVLKDEQPNREAHLTFPGGRVDSGESIEAATRREVHEETGYEFKNWRLVKVYQPQTKIEWFVYLYIAWDGEKTARPHLDGGEKITIQLMTFEETKQLVMARSGYLGGAYELFENASDVAELLNTPQFIGKEINR